MTVMNYYSFMNFDPSKPRENPIHSKSGGQASLEDAAEVRETIRALTAAFVARVNDRHETTRAEELRALLEQVLEPQRRHMSFRSRVKAREDRADATKRYGRHICRRTGKVDLFHGTRDDLEARLPGLIQPVAPERVESVESVYMRGLAGAMAALITSGSDIGLLARLLAEFRAEATANAQVLRSATDGPMIAPPNLISSAESDPLAAARARGRQFAFTEYGHSDNLPLLDARTYAGRNERSINEARQRGELYALVPPGKTRGFRYPKWQFDAEPHRLIAVLEPFVQTKANCWVVHSFMLGSSGELRGKTPAQVILDPTQDLRPVISMASRQLTEKQGAL
jgi:hypothetical protein